MEQHKEKKAVECNREKVSDPKCMHQSIPLYRGRKIILRIFMAPGFGKWGSRGEFWKNIDVEN